MSRNHTKKRSTTPLTAGIGEKAIDDELDNLAMHHTARIFMGFGNRPCAPTLRREALKIFLAILTIVQLIVHQVDIVKAYPKSLIDDNKHSIYMKSPPVSTADY